ncbi:Thaumatin domain-containing protein, partial [Cephalotus follicularis]
FTLQNRCGETIWPGILANAGRPQLMGGGLQLNPGQIINVGAPTGWSGRIWGRRGCTFNQSGRGSCITGDCGGVLKCAGTGTDAAIFTLQNRCRETIWPGILATLGKPQLMGGGFRLNPGQTINVGAPTGWSGRIWGRRGCSFDQSGRGSCVSGDCGGVLKCSGVGGVPPATLAEFTLNSPLDYYDMSLVDGFNLLMSIIPSNGSCKRIGCRSDVNQHCPAGLQVKRNNRVVACKSACFAFNQPQYCCTGAYGNPNTCKPTNYSKIFKDCCPSAYSYAYDDRTSLFTCNGANYLIRFC